MRKLKALTNVLETDGESIELRLEKFQKLLNKEPDPRELESTPDGSAKTLPISFIEMTLDEMFFGLWSIENFKWSVIANEIQGSIELVLWHPVACREIRRAGAGSVTITVDKVPEELKNNTQSRNRWALDPSNKKPNALDLAFPKLKAECLKNAAQSLGKAFGRDINRKKSDTYKPLKHLQLERLQQSETALNSEDKIRKALASGKIDDEKATQLMLSLTK